MNLKKIILSVFVVLVVCIITILIYLKNTENKNEVNNTQSEQNEVEELKKEIGIPGNNNLYEINTEYDGQKVLDIKEDIQYKIAFAGIIKQAAPDFNEIDTIFEEQYPNESGVWIDITSREKFQQMLKECANNEYEISENGFVKIKAENNPTDIDKSLKKMIENEKRYIITISGIYYQIDRVTGQILDNFYEDLDPYQAIKTVSDKDNIIIFLSTNTQKKLTTKEILQELIACI